MKTLLEISELNDKNHEILWKKLLSFGGHRVTERYEEDLEKILNRGYLVKSNISKVDHVAMKRSRCHENASCFWYNYTKEHGIDSMYIATGWALSDDGLWRQHTWLVDPSDGGVIETTVERLMYFGFKLTNEESEIFYDENY